MTKLSEIYRCNVCGNVVEVLYTGVGELVCCGKPMQLLEEKTQDEFKEKHVPIVKIEGKNIHIDVGSVPHPMEEKHYIGLIELRRNGAVIASASLKPGDRPAAEFCLGDTSGITARIWCNIHGVWKS
jgi:superoxide reductase